MEEAKKKVMGRPTKYKEEFCQLLWEHMCEGFSFESFAHIAGVTVDCLYKWEKKHPDFLYAKKRGRAGMLYHYEKILKERRIIEKDGDRLNNGSFIWEMKNKLGWSDKVQVEQKAQAVIRIDQEDSEL